MNPAAGLFLLQSSQICPVAHFRRTGLDSIPDTGCRDEGGSEGGRDYDARRLQDFLVRRQIDGRSHRLSRSHAQIQGEPNNNSPTTQILIKLIGLKLKLKCDYATVNKREALQKNLKSLLYEMILSACLLRLMLRRTPGSTILCFKLQTKLIWSRWARKKRK